LFPRKFEPRHLGCFPTAKTLRDIVAVLHDNLWPLGGLVAQLVEQCPFNSKTPILAIFSSFYFPFATIAKPLISLVIIRISMSSLVVS
jgi:hypothetical protein